MPEHANLLLAGAGGLTALGFAWLALAMEVHWEQVHGHSGPAPIHQRMLRVMGSLLLVASLVLCLAADHASMAVLVWAMLLAGAAILVAFMLSWRPGWLRVVWPLQ